MILKSVCIRSDLFFGKKDNTKNTTPSSKKFSNFQIFNAFFNPNPKSLRSDGYNPLSLYESSKLSFDAKQLYRGRAQCHVMTRFTPEPSEVPVYEKSGDLLSSHDLPKQAREHWQIAFDHGHKPFDMTMNLGRYSLRQGYVDKACQAFDYLSKMPNAPYYVHNERGVAELMLATKQNTPIEFVKHRLNALSSFDKASQLQTDQVVTQNKQVASLLTVGHSYKHPYSYLEFKKGSSTRMIDALMQDLSNNQHEVKCATGMGLTPVIHPNGGGTCLSPVVTTTSYRVPHIPNQLALHELTKLKQEQLSEEELSSRAKFSK